MEVSTQLGPAEWSLSLITPDVKKQVHFLKCCVLEELSMQNSGQNSSHICSYRVLLKGPHHIIV